MSTDDVRPIRQSAFGRQPLRRRTVTRIGGSETTRQTRSRGRAIPIAGSNASTRLQCSAVADRGSGLFAP
jgi:hypothetical protein